MTEPPTFEAFRDDMLAKARSVGDGFKKPDDDWAPVLIADTPDGLVVMPLRGPLIDDPRYAAALLVELKARLACRVQGAWALKGAQHLDGQVQATEPPPRKHPERIEILIVHVVQAGRIECWMADIERHPDAPPTLGELGKGDAEGPMPEVLQAAMNAVAQRG